MTKETYIIELVRPAGVTVKQMKDYIADAIETYSLSFRPPGSYDDDDPGDLLFGRTKCTVKKLATGAARSAPRSQPRKACRQP